MKTVDDYLSRLAAGLDFLDPETAKDLVDEMRSHIMDMAEAAGKDPDEIAAGLGSPEEIAASYREEFGQDAKGPQAEKTDEEKAEGKGSWGWKGPWPGEGPWSCCGEGGPGHQGREHRRHRHGGGPDFEHSSFGHAPFGRPPFPPFGPFPPFDSFFQDRMRRAFDDIFAGGGQRGSKTVDLKFPVPERFRIDLRSTDLSLAPAESGTELEISFDIEGSEEAIASWEPMIESDGARLAVSTDNRPFRVRVLSARVKAPAGTGSIEAKTFSGDIKADGLPCAASFSALSGNIESKCVGSAVAARTMSGSVRIEGAGDIEVSTASGSVEIMDADGRIAVSTASGRIRVSASKGQGGIDARTLSGDVEIGVSGGDAKVEISSTSGNLAVNGQQGRNRLERIFGSGARTVSARSVSGNVGVDVKD